MVFGSGAVTSLWTTIKRTFGPRQDQPPSLNTESVGPPPPPDDRQPSRREWTPSPWDVTAIIQSDIDSSEIDVRSPTIGPIRPRSPETRASQKGPRYIEDRPELGPPGDRSRFTEEAVLGSGERRSSRIVDDRLPGYDRISFPGQTSSRYTDTVQTLRGRPLPNTSNNSTRVINFLGHRLPMT